MAERNKANTIAWSPDAASQVIAPHLARRAPLLEVLRALQEAFGYIDDSAVSLVAEALNLSRAEVHGVVTFYRDFRRAPAGRSTLRLCRAESCQAMGADELVERARERLGVGLGETTADGAVTLEQVFCLGLCALSPAATLDGRLVARLSLDRLDALLARVAPGS